MKKYLSVTLILGLVSFLFSTAYAGGENNTTEVRPWNKAGIGKEDKSLRDRFSKHFFVSPTQKQAMMFSAPIHFKDGNDWKEINTEIRANNTGNFSNHPYVNTDNEFISYYPANPAKDGFVVDYKGTIIKEKVKGLSFVDKAGGTVGNLAFTYNQYKIVGKNQIRYIDVLPGMDLVYTQNNVGKKMVVELKNALALNSIPSNAFKVVIDEDIEIPAGAVHSSIDNQIQIKSDGVLIASYQEPIANQGLQTKSEDDESMGSISVTRNGSIINFKSEFDASWINSTNRTFPILLDPTANYGPFNVSFATGRMRSTTGSKESGYIRLSTSSTTGWAKFNIGGLSTAGATSITSAKYYGYHYTGTISPNKMARVRDMNNTDPTTAANTAIRTQATTGTSYTTSLTWGTGSTYGWHNVTLGTTANTNIYNHVTRGWTALGFTWASGSTGFSYHYGYNATSNVCYLQIVYNVITSPNDAGILSVAAAANCVGVSQDIKVKLKNPGTTALTSATVNWQMDTGSGYVTQTPFSYTGSLATGADTTLTVGSFTFSSANTSLGLKAYPSLPNGVADTINSNDTATSTINGALSGVYTIGGTTPDFATFNAAKTALYTSGICGNVVFNVRQGTYSEQILFSGKIGGTSASNTIRFRPDPANTAVVKLTYTSGYNISFSGGVDYVAFDSLRIEGGFFNNITWTGNSDHISFTGNTVVCPNTSYTIFFFNSTTVKPTNTTIKNNKLEGAYNSIYFRNSSSATAGLVDNITIQDNEITGFRAYGIHLYGLKNSLVHNNKITSATTGVTWVYGIYAYYCDFTDFTSNNIVLYNSSTQYARGLYIGYCDGSTSNRSLIANNMVSATNQSTSSSYFNWINRNNYNDIVFNSFYTKRTSTTTTYGAVRIDYGTSVVFRNNVVFNDAAGYALRVYGTQTRSNNNLKGGNGATRHITGATQGANGLNIDPSFTSTSDLHTGSVGMYQKAIPFAGVTTDIDGDTRHVTTPSMGADEYVLVANDAGVQAIVLPAACPGTVTVKARIKNYGVAKLGSFIANWTLTTGSGSPVTQTPVSNTDTIQISGDTLLTLGTFTVVKDSIYAINVYTTSPNGVTDQKTSNDTMGTSGYKSSMNGVYTIGGTSPDFATFNAARIALEINGICASVIFNVRSGTYTERVDFQTAINGTSSANTIRFRPDPANTAATKLTYFSDYTIRFGGGVSYVAFDSLNLETTSFANVVEMNTNNDHISFTGNTFKGVNTTSSFNGYAVVYDWNGNNTTNFSFINNTVNDGGTGIYLRGSGTSIANNQDGFVIKNNTFNNTGYYGLYLYYVKNGTVEGNTITMRTPVSSSYGIYGIWSNWVDIVSNKIVASGSSWARPLYLDRMYGSSTNRSLIANNMISSTQANNSSSAYNYFNYCNYNDIINNSFYCIQNYTSSSYGNIRMLYGTSVAFRNNAIHNAGAGYAMREYGTHTKSNNCYFGNNGTRNLVGGTGGTGVVYKNPQFKSATDLHTESFDLYRKGVAFSGLTKDIDGDTRFTTPCIGADEYIIPAIDAAPTEVYLPASCPGVVSLKARIENKGLDTLTSFTVNWSVAVNSGSAVVKTPVTWSGTLLPGNDTLITLGNQSMAGGSTYTVEARTSSPNATTDQRTSNDTVVSSLVTAMNGTYSIGGLTPNYATIAAAIADLNLKGVCGAVVFDIRPGTYIGLMKMGEVLGASAVNTITWKGSGVSNTTISYAGNSTNYATVELVGTDYMAFKHLKITNTYTGSYSTAIRLHDGANNITVDSCELSTSSQFTAYGLLASTQYYSSTGAVNNNITVSNSVIDGVGDGINMRSNSTTNRSTNIRIENNTFTNIAYNGIYLNWYFDSVNVVNNDLSEFGGGTYGLYCYYVKNLTVDRNEIVAGSNYAMYLYRINYTGGISSNICKVTNNMVSQTGASYAMYLYYANYADVYHNSVRAKSSFAMYDRFGTGKEIKNNIFYSETNYAYYSGSTTTSYITSLDNNVYYRGNSTSIAYHGGARTLASWKTYRSTLNINSVVGDPKFVASDDLRIANGKPADSLGATGIGVPKDIFDTTRSTTHPDAGADEFDYSPIDGYLVGLSRPNGMCLGATDTLEFEVVNVGGDTIKLGTNGVSIAWSVTGPNTASGNDAANVGSVAPGDTVRIKTANSVINLSSPGKYTVTAVITSAWDKYNENDTLVQELDRIATESITAVKDTTVYYKDSLNVTAQSVLGTADVVWSEMSQCACGTGQPTGGRPSYFREDDWSEISTAKGGVSLEGYIVEAWIGTALSRSHTLASGVKTSPNGTVVIGWGSGVSSPSNYYWTVGGVSNPFYSSLSMGYILKDPSGNIVDVAASNGYSFPGAAGVTSAMWSGTVASSGSTEGIRRNGPDVNSATGWIPSSNTNRQNPNVLNSGMNLKSTPPPNFKWTYNGTLKDTLITTQSGPWAVKGTKDYIASFVSPCTGDTIKDTATIVAFATNAVLAGNTPEYYSYPMSQTGGIDLSGSVRNLGDSLSNIRVNATLGGAAAGDTLVSSVMARFGNSNYVINNSATVTTTGIKNIVYHLNTTDDFPNDDTVKTSTMVTDTVMARENGMLNYNIVAAGFNGFGQRFTVFTKDSVTGAEVYVKTSFPGDKFKVVLYNLNGNSVGTMINESADLTLVSTSDTGLKSIRFNCLSVLNPGDYMLAVQKTSTVFSSGIGGNAMNAKASTAFGLNTSGNWGTVVWNGNPFNVGIRMVFGSYDYPTFAAVAPVCVSGSKFLLAGGSPTGGSYFGTGVSGDSLTPSIPGVGVQTVYYTVTNALGCPDTIARTVDVKAEPTVSSTFTQLTSCVSNNAAISVTATNGFGTLGYSINNGSSYQSTGTFNSVGSGSYTVVVKDSVCVVTDTTYVAAPPGAPNKPSATGGAIYCKGDLLNKVKVTTNASGTAGIFKWYKDGSLTQSHGNGDSIAPTDTIMTQVYYVIEDRLGCISAADTTTVTINALPVVANSALSNRCTNTDTITLATGTPTGGTYSGSGVSGGVFNPNTAGSGTHVITYSYTDANNCSNTDTASVTIYQAPVVTMAALDSHCTNTPKYNLAGGLPSGGVYSGFGVSSGQFDPNTSGQGVHTVQYKVTNTNCVDSASSTVRIHPTPTAVFTSIADRCINTGTLTLSGGTPIGGTYIGNGVAGGIFDPLGAGVGTHSIKYVYTDNNMCTDSTSTNAHVDSLPDITFTSLSAVCSNTPRFALTQGSASPTGGTGTYFGTGVTSGVDFTALTAGVGTTSIGYAYVDGNGCRDTSYENQVVDSVTLSSWNKLTDVCIDATPFGLSGGAPTGGAYSGKGVQTGGLFRADSAGAGSHSLNYVYTNAKGCKDSTMQTQVVNALPLVNVTLPANWCLNAAPIKLASGTPKGGTYRVNGVVDTMYKVSVSKVDTVVYSFTDSNTCTNTALASIKADTVPIVTFGSITTSCIGYKDFTLTQGVPAGGIYSGNNIRLGKVYMSNMVTTDTLTYTFIDSNRCTDSATQVMTVNALPVVTITNQADVCENAPSFALSGGAPTGGSYSGGGVSAGNYNASTFGVGTDNITYVFTDANNCTDSSITPLVVHKVTTAGLHWLGYTCDNSPATNLVSSGLPKGGVFSGTAVSSNNFDPAVAGVGTHNLTYVYTNANSCQDSIKGDIIVEASPVFKITSTDLKGCGKEGVLLWTNLPGKTYKWSNGDRTDTARIHKNGIAWVKITDPLTQELCSNSDSVTVSYDAVCVGIDEALAGTSVRYFPNPNSGNFYYELQGFDGMDVDVSIQSMSGQVVYETTWNAVSALHTGQIQVEVFESGVYFINLKTEKGSVMHRITINR